MIDWTKPLKPAFSDLYKVEFLRELQSNTKYRFVVLITHLNTSQEDVYFVDKNGENYMMQKVLASNVEPVKPQKHVDVIKAWADGYKIAAFSPALGDWYEEPLPIFDSEWYYAVIDGQGYEGPAKVVKL